MEFSAEQIAAFLQGQVEGDPKASVHTFAKIEEGTPGALSFLSNPKYNSYLYETESSIVLVNRDLVLEHPVKATLVRVENAYESIAKLLSLYESMKPAKKGISPLASISESATIGQDVYIGPFAVIGDNARIGDRTQIYPHVTIGDGASVGADSLLYHHVTVYHGCKVGNRCIMHAGSVLGADGFGFAPAEGGYEKIPQIGIAELADDVEIGANTCVDRSTMGRTFVGKGVKLDNLVQIGHNVEIGENTVMSAQGGVAGSAKIGAWSMFGGQVGIAGHITLGDHLNCGAQSGIAGSEKGGQTLMGSPAMEHRIWARSAIITKKLPDMYRELQELKKELAALKATIKEQNV
ncbi:MAG: UDP-3-O-(3-hydroxymyristoyl)glucosamine N-acyltransferase [Bacteroidaceae bacterium]|nr:UDP-3-O-(3-hydroxymyristoyl)glucosamine N-acyltransferase [Bacteroidaceae bacterium]